MQAVGGGGGEVGVVVVDHVKSGVFVEEGEDACGGGGEGVGCCFLGCRGEGGEEEQGCEEYLFHLDCWLMWLVSRGLSGMGPS